MTDAIADKWTLRSITTADDYGNPLISVVPGEVSADVFNRAHEAEGWEGDPMPASELQTFWIVQDGLNLRISHDGDPDAKPYTGFEW